MGLLFPIVSPGGGPKLCLDLKGNQCRKPYGPLHPAGWRWDRHTCERTPTWGLPGVGSDRTCHLPVLEPKGHLLPLPLVPLGALLHRLNIGSLVRGL